MTAERQEMPDRPDVPVRPAATVVLLRDAASGLEAWLLTRVTGMVFAAGMSVFPGGRVDEADAALPMAGGDFPAIAARFGCDETAARGYVGAAVRETFEETGVLLTVPAPDPAVELSAARTDVEAGRVSFGDLLREHGLALDADALHPWSRWITPPGERRRYDTHFFVGALPPGAEAQDVTTESSSADWVPVAEALEQAQRGERMLLPPTVMTLASLAGFATVADAVATAAGRTLEPIQPHIYVDGDAVVAELADGTAFRLPKSMFT